MRQAPFSIAIIALSSAFCLSLCAETVDYVWDFEKGNSDWLPVAPAEVKSSEAFKGIVTLSEKEDFETKDTFNGNKCLRISDTLEDANPYAGLSFTVDPKPGRRYIFSGWLRSADKEPHEALARIVAYKDGKNIKSVAEQRIKATGSWREFSVSVGTEELPDKGIGIKLGLNIMPFADTRNLAAKGSIFVDVLRFVESASEEVDLSGKVNRPFKDDPKGGSSLWRSEAETTLGGIKGGRYVLAKIPFTTPKGGLIALSAKEGFAKDAEVKIGKAFDWLYLLNNAAWAPKGTELGLVVFKYADGSRETVRMKAGDQSADWWCGEANNASPVKLSFFLPGMPPHAQIFVTPLKNPQPGKAVESILLQASREGQPARCDHPQQWFVLAMTLGYGGEISEKAHSLALYTDYGKWFPFDMSLKPASGNALVDLTELLDAPAGRHGFVQSKGGHFVFEDGTPARFLGTNIDMDVAVNATHEQSALTADTLARYGVNLVRLQYPEFQFIDQSYPDTQHFTQDQAKLDRFDYFVFSLKKRGIYLLLGGLAHHVNFKAGDGVAGYDIGGSQFSAREWSYYDPVIMGIAKNFMKTYLSRVNKYTGKALIDEPAVAMLNLINEESVFMSKRVPQDPPYYDDILKKRFSEWLLEKYGSDERLAKAWTEANGKCALAKGESAEKGNVMPISQTALLEMKRCPHQREIDSVAFFSFLQTEYFKAMKAELKAIGLKVPLDVANAITAAPDLRTRLITGYTAQDPYFDHPRWKDFALLMTNLPVVHANPFFDKPVEPAVARIKVASLPVCIPETDVPWPNEWRSSHLLSLASTGALQDWDALLQFGFLVGMHYTWDKIGGTKRILVPMVEFNDPAMFGVFPAASLLYHRRDVAPAKNLIQVDYSGADLLSQRKFEGEDGFPFTYAAYVSRIESTFGQVSPKADVVIGNEPPASAGQGFVKAGLFDFIERGRTLTTQLDSTMKKRGILDSDKGLQGTALVSDTGELTRDWGKGLLLIDTPRSQGFSGFPSRPLKFKDVEIATDNGFATIVLSSLDGQPLSSARRVLLTTIARAWNDIDTASYKQIVEEASGFQRGLDMTLPITNPWDRTKYKEGRVLVEPVELALKMKAKAAKLTPLAPDMTAGGPGKEFLGEGGVVSLKAGRENPSIWYLLELNRP